MIGKLECTLEDEASETFVRRLNGDWNSQDEAQWEARIREDSAYADAFRRLEQSWNSLAAHAETADLIRYREEALAYARYTSGRRWMRAGPFIRARHRIGVAAVVFGALLTGMWELYSYGLPTREYRTGLGEQRTVELADHSRISLDSVTRLNVRFTGDARTVELKEGQAQFTVAHDVTRPFKVQAGDQTIIALGTVFAVEYVDHRVRVALVEGRVTVVGAPTHAVPAEISRTGSATVQSPAHREQPVGVAPRTAIETPAGAGAIELSAGQELKLDETDGAAVLVPKADLEAAMAWRSGKLIFRSETLEAAVRRVNRYSRLQVALADGVLASRQISGVFDAGDTQGFVNALQEYLPISVERGDSLITLRSR